MSQTQPLPPKKEVALALLERSSVHLHLDPRVQGVVVPTWLKKGAQLVLQVGLNMPVPIPDLRLDEDGMSCTLSFNRSPFFCIVPWQSVFAIVGDDGRGMVWPDDVPPEVAQQASAQAQENAARKEPARRPVLQEVRAVETTPAKPKRSRKKPQAVPAVRDADGAKAGPRAAPPLAAARKPEAVPARERLAPVPVDAPQTPRSLPVRPQPPARPGAQRKPKRELPPYLRVVK